MASGWVHRLKPKKSHKDLCTERFSEAYDKFVVKFYARVELKRVLAECLGSIIHGEVGDDHLLTTENGCLVYARHFAADFSVVYALAGGFMVPLDIVELVHGDYVTILPRYVESTAADALADWLAKWSF